MHIRQDISSLNPHLMQFLDEEEKTAEHLRIKLDSPIDFCKLIRTVFALISVYETLVVHY